MPQQRLTIIPVSLHPKNDSIDATIPATFSSNPTCTIKTSNAEISFFNGIDERIIQTIMKELNNP